MTTAKVQLWAWCFLFLLWVAGCTVEFKQMGQSATSAADGTLVPCVTVTPVLTTTTPVNAISPITATLPLTSTPGLTATVTITAPPLPPITATTTVTATIAPPIPPITPTLTLTATGRPGATVTATRALSATVTPRATMTVTRITTGTLPVTPTGTRAAAPLPSPTATRTPASAPQLPTPTVAATSTALPTNTATPTRLATLTPTRPVTTPMTTTPIATPTSGTPAPPATPAPADTVYVRSHSSYRRDSTLFVVGEIVNGSVGPIYRTRITATFFNNSDQVVATQEGSAYLAQTSPDQRNPFKLQVDNAPDDITRYELSLRWDDVSVVSYQDLTITSQELRQNEGPVIAGELRNDFTENLGSVVVVVTLYDAAGNVVDAYQSTPRATQLAPNEVSPYEVPVAADPPFTTFAVQSQGKRAIFF